MERKIEENLKHSLDTRHKQSNYNPTSRKGKIGLRAFLFQRHVPTIATPICPCGEGPQTVEHLLTNCVDERSRRLQTFGYTTEAAARAGLVDLEISKSIARALLESGWLTEYRLSQEFWHQECIEAAQVGWTYRPPPQRAKRRRRRSAL